MGLLACDKIDGVWIQWMVLWQVAIHVEEYKVRSLNLYNVQKFIGLKELDKGNLQKIIKRPKSIRKDAQYHLGTIKQNNNEVFFCSVYWQTRKRLTILCHVFSHKCVLRFVILGLTRCLLIENPREFSCLRPLVEYNRKSSGRDLRSSEIANGSSETDFFSDRRYRLSGPYY